VINGPFAKGNHTWNNGEGSGVLTQLAYSAVGDSHDFYGSYYMDGSNNVRTSGGGVKVTSIDPAKKIVEGTFSASPAGHIVAGAAGQTETVSITGAFRLKYE